MLLKFGADINALDENNYTSLSLNHFCIKHVCKFCFNLLLKSGANLNQFCGMICGIGIYVQLLVPSDWSFCITLISVNAFGNISFIAVNYLWILTFKNKVLSIIQCFLSISNNITD
ncbi:hypothetical protein CEXT_530641 [Caerostris extrusa]|uniref:Uncharacterized protein n=1 Tax=Caerostris extrusa TaxID=172846 RepID=A0AAV4N7U8_CAEEX|nr:hypothetical protein CEXT_530641 [Caerostris extrusa]